MSPLSAQPQNGQESGRFILIHLDGVSSKYFQSEMEAGNLPNLEEAFREHGIIEEAVTYLPSKTATVISSLHEGIPGSESSLVSWAGINRETGKNYSAWTTFKGMVRGMSRLSVSNLIYGIPYLDGLAGPALANLPDLLDDYPVLEFYWYPIDTAGHFFGEETYLKKLRNFDKDFGRLMQRLRQKEMESEVNIVIYSDHGMTFGEGIRVEAELQGVLADHIVTASYPNLFVVNEEEIPEIAAKVEAETPVDYVFYRTDENSLTGIHSGGTLLVETDSDERLSYRYEGEDLFGYYSKGYNGEALTPGQWLEFSYNTMYPAAPIHLHNLLLNPGAGDILTFLGENRFSQTGYSKKGNHGGITAQDINIPILLRGPQVEHLYERETLWLQQLFPQIGEVPFRTVPERDEHTLSWWHGTHEGPTIRLLASPRYRWAAGAETSFQSNGDLERFRTWVQFDLFRSYLVRFWVAGGMEADDDRLVPMFLLRHELRYQKLTARTILSTTGHHEFALEFRLTDLLSLQFVNLNSAGLRFHF